jgi:hypothetical protein
MTGGCLCGDIRYEISGEPLFVAHCCCKDCQKATGAGHTTIMGVTVDQLHIKGEPKVYASKGGSGGAILRHFCANCGGRLYTAGDTVGDVRIVQCGSLDDPNQVKPMRIVYAKDRISWDYMDPSLPAYEESRSSDASVRFAPE